MSGPLVGMPNHETGMFAAFFNERAKKRHAWIYGRPYARCSTVVRVASSLPFRIGDANNCVVCEREIQREAAGDA